MLVSCLGEKMGESTNLVGQVFDRLQVLSRNSVDAKCHCSCGNIVTVKIHALKSGHVRSCGCLSGEKHGLSSHRLYNTYRNMVARCTNPLDKSYPNYGGRGIKVLFTSVQDFIDKMYPSYVEGYTLDRVDVNGHYEESNCRWASVLEQHNNRRDNIYITVNGTSISLANAARLYNIKIASLRSRYLVDGDNFESLFRPIKGRVLYDELTKEPIKYDEPIVNTPRKLTTPNGVLTLKEVSKLYGITESTIHKRFLKYGDNFDSVTAPTKR